MTAHQEARNKRVTDLFNENVGIVEKAISEGKKVIDLFIDKDFAYDVKELLNEKFAGNDYDWAIVKRGNNRFTGKPESFTSDTIGDNKYYQLKYLGN